MWKGYGLYRGGRMNRIEKGLLQQQIMLLRSAVGNAIDHHEHSVHEINYNEIFRWLEDILRMIE
uniref:Uncharacterized protein n=1 Tax=uncultured prokaryote TaxID=198431 RepID=A0A0H5Q885_9ZZZZ|nr:hypothetical protein [uncultured prokaryote]